METSPSPAGPQRKHFAAGEYITHFPPGSPREILIDSPREKRGWNARSPGTAVRAEFPGTAVLIEDRYYEVIRIERRSGEQPRFLYSLNPWPDHFPIRVQFAYTPEECERAAALEKAEQQESATRTVLTVLAPLVGLLPAADQRELQNTYGISALKCTMLSALLVLVGGVLAVLLAIVSMISPESMGHWPLIGSMSPVTLGLAGIILCGESVLRFISTRHDEPIGSLLSFPLEIARAVKRHYDPAYRQMQFVKMKAPQASVFLNARDEIREMNETDLEIVSILPKPDWSPLKGISYNNNWYGCIDSSKIGEAPNIRYRFVLRQTPPGTTFRTTCEYHAEEVRDRYREERRLDLGTWVDTFAPFWGLLDGQDQNKLQLIYGFNASKYTAWTIVILLVAGSVNVLICAFNFASHTAHPSDMLWLAGGGYLLGESILRLRKWLHNELSGSALGFLVSPFAARLLDPALLPSKPAGSGT